MGFKVLLGGIGGDELFFGYNADNQLANTILLKKKQYDLLPFNRHKWDFLKFAVKHWRTVLFDGHPYKADEKQPVAWTLEDYQRFCRTGRLEHGGETIRFNDYDVHFSLNQRSTPDDVYQQLFCFMRELCLYLADRLSMAASIELRSPFLDRDLVAFVASLPLEMRFRLDCPKSFLKDMLRGTVPDYILDARKRGFTPPTEFIYQINQQYRYQMIESDYVFFNSMLADKLLARLLL